MNKIPLTFLISTVVYVRNSTQNGKTGTGTTTVFFSKNNR